MTNRFPHAPGLNADLIGMLRAITDTRCGAGDRQILATTLPVQAYRHSRVTACSGGGRSEIQADFCISSSYRLRNTFTVNLTFA